LGQWAHLRRLLERPAVGALSAAAFGAGCSKLTRTFFSLTQQGFVTEKKNKLINSKYRYNK
jgi:hypothetical protein